MDVCLIAVGAALLGWSIPYEGQSTMLEAIAVAGVALVGSILSNAYFYGRLTERVEGSTTRIDKLEKSDDKQWAEISDLGERVTWVEAKANGKGAGA